MVNLFKARRKSAGNVLEETAENEKFTSPEPSASASSGFKVLSQVEIAAKKESAMKKQQDKEKPKFGRFSGFGGNGNKSRQQSMDDDSPGSSKRDSKSSSGTQFSNNRPYHVGQFGSTSTLPSSADTDPNDNMFASLPPRPHIAQHSSSPSSLSMAGMKKALPTVPYKAHDASTRYYGAAAAADDPVSQNMGSGRSRAMTTSSYASTAIPPKLDSDLNFGGGFDDLFTGLDRRRDSPDFMDNTPGRSLLAGKRAGQPEPIDINRKLEVEPALASWDSRGSGENLISSPEDMEDNNTPPPPVPPHKYAPVASQSPDLSGGAFQDADANFVRQSVMSRKSVRESSPEQKPYSFSSSGASFQTPLSSRTGSDNTTPKAPPNLSAIPIDGDDENMFTPSHAKDPSVRKPAAPPIPKENMPPAPPPATSGDPGRKVMTAAEFRALKDQQRSQPVDDSSDSEDYEDEEDAIRQREEEELKMRKKQQQMQIAREALRRSTTAPIPENRPESFAGGMGFPSEASLQADQWDDEDVPLGMLAAHLPAKQNMPLSQTATPSYLPERPASAGAMSNRASQAYRPVFARNLPEDPYSSPFVGGGLVRQGNRESMGFNRAASVYGEPMGGSMPYADAAPQFPTLVGQIQMRESSKQKYTGGASSKNPTEGPFTGALGAQMNGTNQQSTRMSQMPMQGMGMNPMMNMMNGGMMGMGMGMGQMQYPMQGQAGMMQDPQYQQMQQMLMAQQNMLLQFQAQQAGMFNQQMPQDPRMSMFGQQMQGFPQPGFPNNSSTNLAAPMQNQRPMSIMSGFGNQPMPQARPYSAVTPGATQGPGHFGQHLGPGPGYTASIAPSERSNIGMSSRYRPVTTGNGMQDHMSSVSSQTLQAPQSNGPQKVKGILKTRPTTQVTAVREDDEDDWSKMKARKNKFLSNANGGARDENSALSDLDARIVF